ncbi:alpha/beta hydrolase [Caldalkalibacillus salinus]|uniref:alpha/beta hydrolase n=1 Tax=Caldalkalibacillus salinus TaxID=2803787 RepID=UPI00192144F5|nr:alpha/beta fold hydrolase [Caldalkalibacillus salinus]
MEHTTLPQPLTLKATDSKVGVLLIHGFTGTTNEIRELGEYLHAQGYTVHAPLLKGHGCTPEEMACTTWVDWWVSAKTGYSHLKALGCEHIVPVGLSMGGLLSLKIAQYERVLGIVTLCAPIKVHDRRMGLAQYLYHLKPYLKRREKKAYHIEKELFIYDRTPIKCIASLHNLMENVGYALPVIRAPIMIIQSEQDETVDPCSGRILYQKIGSATKELKYFQKSGHIITLDEEKDDLFDIVHQYIKRLERSDSLDQQGNIT